MELSHHDAQENDALLSGDCVLGCGTTVFSDLHAYMHSLEVLKQAMRRPGQEISKIYPGHGPVIRHNAIDKIDEYIHHRNARERQIISCLRSNGVSMMMDAEGSSSSSSSSRDVRSCDDVVIEDVVEDDSGAAAASSSSSYQEKSISIVMSAETTTMSEAVPVTTSSSSPSSSSRWMSSWDIMSAVYAEQHLSIVLKASAQHNVRHHLMKLEKDGRVERRWPDLWRACV